MKRRHLLAAALIGGLVLATDSTTEREAPMAAPMPLSAPESWRNQSARSDRLIALFQRIGYDLDAVRRAESAVPRLLVPDLPTDLADIGSAGERKKIFIAVVLPAVLVANEEVRSDRAVVERARAPRPRRGARRRGHGRPRTDR